MNPYRKPFLVIALVFIAAVVGLEIGSAWIVVPGGATQPQLVQAMIDEGLDEDEREEALEELRNIDDADRPDDPPGLAIPMMALVDGMMLLSMVGLVAALLVPHGVQGRVVPVVNLVVGILVVLGGIVAVFVALALLLLMIGLFLAPPFGTIAYLARWAAFPRGDAQALLSLILLCRLLFAGFVITASPRLLRQKGFMALAITGLLLQLLIGLLHGFAPLPLVSIVDAIAAIVVGIVAVIWALVIAIGSLVGTVRILRVKRA